MITVNSRKYDGTIHRTWKCELVLRRDPLLVFMGEFAAGVDHPDLGLIEKGTLSYEYYWLDRWYSIFRFHEPSGALRNYYCNINMPPEFSDDVLNYVDLDIDVLVRPDLSYIVLDRDEFERNSELFRYPPELNEKVELTLKELQEVIEARNLPVVSEEFATSSAKVRERR